MRTVALVAVILMVGLPCLADSVSLPFYDGFETYDVDNSPPEPDPPWDRYYNANSIVVDTQAFAGEQSYMLRGASGFSDSAAVGVTYPDTFTYQVACRVESGSAGAGQFQFSGAMVYARNVVWFWADDDYISFESVTGGGQVIVSDCDLDTWYFASVTISGFLGSSATADVIVYDDQFNVLGSEYGLVADTVAVAEQQQFVLHTRSAVATTAYFDNVAVIPEPAILLVLVTGGAIAILGRRR